MRVLLTGVTGFAGSHLAEALLARPGIQLFGSGRKAQFPDHLAHLTGSVSLHSCDLTLPSQVEELLRCSQPDQIYHLAGYANPGRSYHEVAQAWAGNLSATLGLYEGIRSWGGNPRILFVGTGLIYGPADNPERGVSEDGPLQPATPYAASKVAADLASYQYTRFPGLDIVRVRPFNHIGPRQSSQYAVAHFARQIAAIERNEQSPVLETGDLSSVRDLTDVRDMVQAYLLLMERGGSGEAYNASSGERHPMELVLRQLLALTHIRIEIRQKPDATRSGEAASVHGDSAKLRRETGWTPRFSLRQTLEDTLNYWRAAGKTFSKEGCQT